MTGQINKGEILQSIYLDEYFFEIGSNRNLINSEKTK